MKSKKIVVLGSTNTDMVITGKKIPVPGETVSGGKFLMNPGGKGANQAVAVARLSDRKNSCIFIFVPLIKVLLISSFIPNN